MKGKFRLALVGTCALFLLVTPCFARLAGTALIDSLRGSLIKGAEDTTQANVLCKISALYYSIYPDSGIVYGERSLVLARKLKWKKGIGNALSVLGTNNCGKSNYPAGLKYYLEAAQVYKEINFVEGEAKILLNLGLTYKNLGDFAIGMSYYQQALDAATRMNDKAMMAKALGSMANSYKTFGDLAKAMEYYLASLKINEEIGDDGGVIIVKINVGGLYKQLNQRENAQRSYEEALELAAKTGNKLDVPFILQQLGSLHTNYGEFAKATDYLLQSLAAAREIEDEQALADGYVGISDMLIRQGRYTHALAFLKNSLPLHEKLTDKQGQANDYMLAGEAYLRLAKNGDAMDLFGEMPAFMDIRPTPAPGRTASLQLAVSNLEHAAAIDKEGGFAVDLQQVYNRLSEAYELNGQYAKALEVMRLHAAITDTIFNQENAQKMARSQMGYEFEKKRFADSLHNTAKVREVHLRYQRQQAYTLAGIGGVLVLLTFSFFAVRSNRLLAREKKRSEDLLLNILPEDVATELKNTGKTTARHFSEVTVLFTDFVNFTQSAEKMKPQALIDELHTCFTKFDDIMHQYGIEKIKTVGDAYLAVAGAPRSDANHAVSVLQAAKEITAYMEDRYAKLGDRTFRVRVGVHSGSIVAGTVGVKKFAYDIWGDSVNIAARMEQNSMPGRINVSQATYELTKGKFYFEYRGEIDAKNKGKLGMYFVV